MEALDFKSLPFPVLDLQRPELLKCKELAIQKERDLAVKRRENAESLNNYIAHRLGNVGKSKKNILTFSQYKTQIENARKTCHTLPPGDGCQGNARECKSEGGRENSHYQKTKSHWPGNEPVTESNGIHHRSPNSSPPRRFSHSPDKRIEQHVYLQKLSRKIQKGKVIIGGLVRGYLTRRLLRSEKVQDIIRMIKDTKEVLETLKNPANASEFELLQRTRLQIQAAKQSLYKIFFVVTTSERMEYIAQSRQRRMEKRFGHVKERNKLHQFSSATLKTLERKQSNTGAATKKQKHTVHFENTASLLVNGEATQDRHTAQHSSNTAANILRSITKNDPDAINFIKSTRRQTSPNITSPIQVSSTSKTNKARRASYTATDLISDDVAERAQRLISPLQVPLDAHNNTIPPTNRARRGTFAAADIHKDSPPDFAKLRTRRQTSPNVTVPLPISADNSNQRSSPSTRARRSTFAAADIHKDISGDSPPDFAKLRTRRQTSPNVTVPLPISTDDSNQRSSLTNRARRSTFAAADIHKDISGDSPPDFAKLRTRRQTSPNITVPLPISADDSNQRSSPPTNRARRSTFATADIHKDISGDSPPDFAKLRTRRQTSPNITVPLPISTDDSNQRSSPPTNRARRSTFATADIHKDISGDSPPDFAKLRTHRQTSPNITVPLPISADDSNQRFSPTNRARRSTFTAADIQKDISGDSPPNFAKLRTRRQTSPNITMPLDLQFNQNRNNTQARRATHTADELMRSVLGNVPSNNSANLTGTKRSRRGTISIASSLSAISENSPYNRKPAVSSSVAVSTSTGASDDSYNRSSSSKPRSMFRSYRAFSNQSGSKNHTSSDVTSSSGKVQVLTGVAAKKARGRENRFFSLFSRKRSKASYPKPSRASSNLAT
ncbi:PREDICTED: uncharacterized protein LOC109580480 isoform X1 [Amphimedon queenslandica]|uniref:Centriolar coiled-coil protein of 110 kDa n=1 Tax=Amphimedon queenslandica TaxID=400682 RepID=A0A1X7VEV0_AMPQE|nr:PREDICTED: uncharacterized protein LOC109580480 isoform X1 [Amphimedon queenslandica]|eukprot:XP_019849260.1 PREDICTED: uncharacterized protein LOC109580480 isoform X1 [Amphimedon queenslandica]